MKAITIINQKGGVGKSTTALAIGAGLQLKGFSVLFVDLDAQGNLSYAMGADSQGLNVMHVLQSPAAIKEEIQSTAQGDIIASSPALTGADTSLHEVGKEYRLQAALENLGNAYDFCIIDTPPSLGVLTVNALTACQWALLPAQADIFSLQGISQLYNTVQTVKKYCNPSLSILGIVLTRYSSRAIITREVTALMEQTAEQLQTELLQTKIRECTAIKEAQAMRQSIFTYAPKSNAAIDYSELVTEILTK